MWSPFERLFLAFLVHYSGKGPHSDVCTTKDCVRAAADLLNSIDLTVDPCEDFHQYACGKWIREHPIPDDMSRYGMIADLDEQVKEQMRELLESEATSPSKSINMAKLIYKDCLNMTELDKLKSAPLLTDLEELGYWPILHGEKWQEKQFDITDLLAKILRMHGHSILFSIDVGADPKNVSFNILQLDQVLPGISRDYFLNETLYSKQLSAYKKYITDVVRLLFTDAEETRSQKQIDQDVNDIIAFEKKFANITVHSAERRNHTRLYNKRKISDLSAMLPQIKWLDFMKKIAPDDVQHYITNDTEIIVKEIEYLTKLSELFKITDTRILTNYILWTFTKDVIGVLDTRFNDIDQEFAFVMSGRKEKRKRWKSCVPIPVSWMRLAAGAIYVREHFDVAEKKEALEMIGNLRDSFGDLVNLNDWMDSQTKKIAIEKAAAMINHIGYPDLVKNDTALDEYYKELNILPTDTFYDAYRKRRVWDEEENFRRLLKPVDKFEFVGSPATVNAWYSPSKNAITFPAAILQPPFFSGGYPKAVNYGAIGAIIGHEITHGFDDSGSQYDKDGNLHDWWSQSASEKFRIKKQCIIDQYGNFSVPGTNLNLNGKLTQGENIADNGGLKESFKAYRNYIEKIGHEEPRLPGLTNFTSDQIFFLSFARNWCGHMKPEAAMQQVLSGPHSPYQFRVTGVVSNMQEFATAFNCSKNSRMNPEKRCVVW